MSTGAASEATGNLVTEDFEKIFREHSGLVYRTAYGVTGRPEDAEDVLQTIFLRLLRREFPPELQSKPKAYLYRAAVNLSLDTVRARQRQTYMADAGSLEDRASKTDSVFEEEMHEQLYRAIAELPPEAAQIVVLRYIHDYTDAEIAKLLGKSRTSIAVRLFRSRARLRKLIRDSMEGKL